MNMEEAIRLDARGACGHDDEIADLQRDLAAAQAALRAVQTSLRERLSRWVFIDAFTRRDIALVLGDAPVELPDANAEHDAFATLRDQRDAAQARVGELEAQLENVPYLHARLDAEWVASARLQERCAELMQERDAARAELAAEREANAVLGEVIRNERAEASALREIVEDRQWDLTDPNGFACSDCGKYKAEGHGSFCKVGKVLAAASQEPDHIGDANKMVPAPGARDAVVARLTEYADDLWRHSQSGGRHSDVSMWKHDAARYCIRLALEAAMWKRRAERWRNYARIYRKAGRIMSETAVFGERLLNRGWRPFIRSVWSVDR